MISTIQGRFTDGACWTIVHSYRLDSESETELRIQVKEILFDDAYLSKVIDDKKSWFTWMEVFDLLYDQYFFTANSLGRQPTISQLFQPLTWQTLALVFTAIHGALSEYTTGKKVTVMFSEDKYRGKFCPSTLIDCITAEPIALIDTTWWGCFIPRPPLPPCCSSGTIGAAPSPLALLIPHSCSSGWIGPPQPGLVLQYFIQRYILPFLSTLILYDWRSSIPSSTWIRSAYISFQTLCLPHLSVLLSMDGMLCWICPPQSPSALLGLDLHPTISFYTPPSPSALPLPTSHITSGTPTFLVANFSSPWTHHIAFQTPF